MNHRQTSQQHQCIPETSTSHPHDPIPHEPDPASISEYHPASNGSHPSPQSSAHSLVEDSPFSSDSESPQTPQTPQTDPQVDDVLEQTKNAETTVVMPSSPRKRRASTKLIAQGPSDVRRILSSRVGEGGIRLIEKVCCGGGCCFMDALEEDPASETFLPVVIPDNDAFRSLQLKLGPLSLDSHLSNIVDLPSQIVSFISLSKDVQAAPSTVHQHPPTFVTPHPPYEVFSAKVHHARELTKLGAEKRTYHFDLDVTNYPEESGNVDFVVGGAIGVCAPNPEELVTEIFDLLNIPSYVRDKSVVMKTQSGRWPTIWGDEMARELVTTRRELLTWCSDVQSYPPSKQLLRLLAEYAEAPNEKKILLYLSSAQGQAAFCDLRTGPHITLAQLLNAFPSSKPPLPHLLSTLNALMPRFYSLSQDPQVSCTREGVNCRRLIEIAVTVHETPNWRGGPRTGVGSGYLERVAKKALDAEKAGTKPLELDLRVPMFRGLMANPLAREFATDGPMLLIGAGVGVAPFRGFVQRRLKSANCANKVWVLQGVRDSLLDELYSGEWGVHEDTVKKVVQSRRGEGRYVQEEVRHQADLVWFIINALDGRVFVCGSSKGMGEGVEKALVDVAMCKGNLNQEEAEGFWRGKKDGGQYIAETW
ncbi:fad binding domain protein [Lasallia pustulata]|uniref:Fad binding domain protein n=1 Tax=Lasallia pustulata TaxID=136370 RepID=A0A1W5D2L7_9LECA|nr:fad binding domain protein [Lasallia pustulata]